MSKLTNKAWWKDVAERTISTMAEVAVILIGSDSIGLTEVDWLNLASMTAMAGVLTILKNIATLKDKEGAN